MYTCIVFTHIICVYVLRVYVRTVVYGTYVSTATWMWSSILLSPSFPVSDDGCHCPPFEDNSSPRSCSSSLVVVIVVCVIGMLSTILL